MGIRLPTELEGLLAEMNHSWPEIDEDKLLELGRHWIAYGSKIEEIGAGAQRAAQEVWARTQGESVEAFRTRWEHEHSPAAVLHDGGTAAYCLGAALFVCASAVVAVKVNVVVQLVVLLIEIIEATSMAAPSQIPVFKEIQERIIGGIIELTVDALAD